MTQLIPHCAEAPSNWITRWSHLVKPKGQLLDVACGHGRHAYHFAQLNHSVTVVDRSQEAVDSITLAPHLCEKVVADIENGPWPFVGRQFDALVVTNYLWRPLLPTLLTSLAPGGVLLYETFAEGNQTVGKPSRPDFLLRRGELIRVCQDLTIVAFEDGFIEGSNGGPARFVQRIVAANSNAQHSEPARHHIS